MAVDNASITSFLKASGELLKELDVSALAKAAEILLDAYRSGRKVFTAGNGGSASTAQHFACDLSKYVIPPGERPFDARCLTDNVSLYTAWANDAAPEDVFVNQMRGLFGPGDVLIASSVHGGTGFSSDLVRAVRFANQAGGQTISLVGFDGGPMHKESTVSILVPAPSTPQVEALHLVIEHLLMHILKEALSEGRA